MKWIVSCILLISIPSWSSTTEILGMDNTSQSISCEVLSELGFPTGDSLEISYKSLVASAKWYKNKKYFETYIGSLLGSEDPFIEKIHNKSNFLVLGFKFPSPNKQQDSLMRVLIVNDKSNWMTSYLIFTVVSSSYKGLEKEVIISNEEMRCFLNGA